MFIRNSFWALGGLLVGGSGVFRFLHNHEPEDYPLPPTVETVHQGKGKNVLVLMSAGTRHGNTDRLTDSFIQGLVVVERLYAISKEDKYPEKDTVLLMTAGDDKAETFDHALGYFHVISGVLGGHEVGTYCAGGCTGCEKTARNIDMTHLENAYRMGLKI